MEKWIGLFCANVFFIENNIGIYCSVQLYFIIYILLYYIYIYIYEYKDIRGEFVSAVCLAIKWWTCCDDSSKHTDHIGFVNVIWQLF